MPTIRALCALLVLVLVGCRPMSLPASPDPIEPPKASAALDDPVTYQALTDAVHYWDERVGFRAPFDLVLDPGMVRSADGGILLGMCVGKEALILYVDTVRRTFPENYYTCLRHTVTHEMIHLHLTCSDADHELGGVMAASADGSCPYEIDDKVLQALQAANALANTVDAVQRVIDAATN